MDMLLATACGICHTVPSPSYLPPEEWPYLMSWMGTFLGHPPEVPIHPALVGQDGMPSTPLIPYRDFDAIRTYYLVESARQYEEPARLEIPPVTPLFEPVEFHHLPPVISMVGVDPEGPILFIGSSQPPGLQILRRGAAPISVPVHTEPVELEMVGDAHRIALMGDLGRDVRQGQVVEFHLGRATRRILVERHHRIVSHRTRDIDGDGHPDLFVCGFGDYPEGRVGIWWGAPDWEFEEQVLFTEPGSTWGEVVDLNGNGLLDVVISVANQRPRILAFMNQGNRQFKQEVLVERPVGWGYNRCMIVDWNGNGKPDIVELAGNNLEMRGRPIKHDHGIRILINQGDLQFEEIHFEPFPGAMDLAAGDFTGNGKVDLAVTSFYPDWRDEVPLTFLMLLQQEDGTIERAGIDDRYWNRWMRVVAADATGDGNTDILLGAAQVPMAIPEEEMDRYQQLLEGKASVLLLRNPGTGAGVSPSIE